MKKEFRGALVFLLASGLAACGTPKYVPYRSARSDYRCVVPWGWNVIADEAGSLYSNTELLGAFDPNVYLGIPSFSIRWYAYSAPHTLRDGTLEAYRSADDFVSQMLKQVYARDPVLWQPVHVLQLAGGRPAKHFVVVSPTFADKDARWGTSRDAKTGQTIVVRKHAYVLFPMKRGFYVLIYPATRDSYGTYIAEFDRLARTFTPMTDGPGGEKLERASGAETPSLLH